jgi:hypothetical protein
MMSVVLELLVVGLLAVTVAYCIQLDRKLQRLRQDEKAMRQTVVDLGLATERAERAIEGLRASLGDCDRTIVERLRLAETASAELKVQVGAGEDVLNRIGKIVGVARQAVGEAEAKAEPGRATAVTDTAAAAEAFAERARRRVTDRAA